MALTRNYLRTASGIRGRQIGASSAGFDMFGWDRPGRRKNRSINWGGIELDNKSAVPYGHLHPSAWLMPQVSGGLAPKTALAGAATVLATMLQGNEITASIQGSSTVQAAESKRIEVVIEYASANIAAVSGLPDFWSEQIEAGLDAKDAMRLIAAAVAGKLSGAASDTVAIRNALADSKNRIVATVDPDGNRINITYDLTD